MYNFTTNFTCFTRFETKLLSFFMHFEQISSLSPNFLTIIRLCILTRGCIRLFRFPALNSLPSWAVVVRFCKISKMTAVSKIIKLKIFTLKVETIMRFSVQIPIKILNPWNQVRQVRSCTQRRQLFICPSPVQLVPQSILVCKHPFMRRLTRLQALESRVRLEIRLFPASLLIASELQNLICQISETVENFKPVYCIVF